MLTYLITFVLSLLFMHSALKSKNMFIRWLCHIMAIAPPVFLLTFRAEECGTDTLHYIWIFNNIDESSAIKALLLSRLEPLFVLLNFFIRSSRLSVEYLFFFCGVLTVAPIYIGSVKMKDKVPALMPMTLFYLMFYQYSFNTVRQSIGMSLIFLSAVYLLNNEKRKAFIIGLSAFFFHTVAIIYFIVYISYIFGFTKSLKGFFITTVTALIIAYISQFVLTTGIDNFLHYVGVSTSMQMSYLLEVLLNFIVVLILWGKNRIGEKRFFLFVSGFVVILFLLSPLGSYLFRIANCLDILLLVYIPMALTNSRNQLYKYSYMTFAFIFWWYIFIRQGNGGTNPYILSPTFRLFWY